MKFHMYKDRNGQYRWRLVAGNGKTIADSGEGYVNRVDCVAAITHVMDTTRSTELTEE
ncbi:DUF1508 domain-containing protein [bacterium]|nr:MAG: DUF1508 domain-containing protein [bacterium]